MKYKDNSLLKLYVLINGKYVIKLLRIFLITDILCNSENETLKSRNESRMELKQIEILLIKKNINVIYIPILYITNLVLFCKLF